MMIEHNRKFNCIQFLGIRKEDTALFVRDTQDGVDYYVKPEAWQSGDRDLSLREDALQDGYSFVIYRMDSCLSGGLSDLQNKITHIFEYTNPDGTFVLLMDNPYALHMFAGETNGEGKLFESLQKRPADQQMIGYNKLNQVLINMFSAEKLKWYYPYPALDFPVAIYSDAYLPKTGDCCENYYNFEHARLDLFSETDAFDEIVKSGMFREFANCYMVVAGGRQEKNIRYCRFSGERAEGLRIRTDILPDSVCKSALEESSFAHIDRLSTWEEKLNQQLTSLSFCGKTIKSNRILRRERGSVTFAFIEGQSLEQQLDHLLAAGRVQEAKCQLLDFCALLRKQPNLKPFVQTREFETIFGSVSKEKLDAISREDNLLLAAPVTDIDMICQNILIGDGIHVIDYEWTFDFPIPVEYVIYRILFFYLEFAGRSRHFGDFDFYHALSISPQMKELFAQMETNFQHYVQGDVTLLSDACYEWGKPVLSIGQLKKQLLSLEQSHIVIRLKNRDGWRQEERAVRKDGNGIVSFTIDFEPDTVETVQILPGVSGVLLRTCLLQEDEQGSRELAFTAGGISLNPILYLFDEPAQIEISELLPKVHRIYVSLEVVALPDTFVVESKRSLCDLKETLANRDKQLDDLYHSTSWKLTRPLRKLKGND